MMVADEIKSTTGKLTGLVENMNETGGFLVSVLTDKYGLPIVFAAKEGFDPERQSATVAMIKKTITQNEKRLGISRAEEINIIDSEGQLLICRSFSANEHELILAVLMTNRQQAYRRITNHTINQIRQTWLKNWK